MNKYLKQKLKKNNGFTGQDIMIAMFIIMLFLSTFTTIMINLSNTSAEIGKVQKVTKIVTKIADKIDAIPYDKIEATTGKKNAKDLLDEEVYNDKDLYTDKMEATYEVTEDSEKGRKTITLKVTYPDVTEVTITIGKQLVTPDGTSIGDENGGNTGNAENTNNSGKIKINTNAQYPFNRPTKSRRKY